MKILEHKDMDPEDAVKLPDAPSPESAAALLASAQAVKPEDHPQGANA